MIFVLFYFLLDVFVYLKNIGFVYGDLYIGNICIVCDKMGNLSVKLVDFGCSVVLRDEKKWFCYIIKDEISFMCFIIDFWIWLFFD